MIDEFLAHVPRLQPGVLGGEVLAARHAYRTEPFFVCGSAVVAILGRRILSTTRCIAGNLLERVVEVLVDIGSVIVVHGGELCHSTICVWITGHGVGDFIAES